MVDPDFPGLEDEGGGDEEDDAEVGERSLAVLRRGWIVLAPLSLVVVFVMSCGLVVRMPAMTERRPQGDAAARSVIVVVPVVVAVEERQDQHGRREDGECDGRQLAASDSRQDPGVSG